MENDGAFVPQTSRAVVTRQTDDSVLSCRDADSLFGESTRVVFCVSFENEKLTLFPSYLNEVAATEKTLLCVLSTRLRADFAIRFVCWRAQVFKVEETRRSTGLPQAFSDCLWSLHRSLSRALSAREESIPV